MRLRREVFPRGRPTLVCGGAGCGKTLLAMEFLLRGRYVDGFSERSHIKVELDLAADLGRLSTDAEIAMFGVVQECLTNVYRHSGSGWCSLKLERQPDVLLLEIRDSGCGMPEPSNGVRPTGVGLRGMEERLRQLDGTLKIDSDANGTTIVAMLPVSEAGSENAA